MHDEPPAHALRRATRHRDRVALDHYVDDPARLSAQQEVADDAPDHPGAVLALEGGAGQ